MPQWLLTFSFWLHMVGTIVWIGGLFYQSAFLYPALIAQLGHEGQIGLLQTSQKRFSTAAWLSLTALVATGMLQLVANPNYCGAFDVSNRWSVAILLKHLAVIAMVLVAGYQTWILQPKLIRLMLLRKSGVGDSIPDRLALVSLQLRNLTSFNLLLGLLVLMLTAVARTA